MTPYRIGLLGASRIAPPAVIQPAEKRDDTVVSVIAARDPARARGYADTHNIEMIADDYGVLATHHAVDIVYNALPPSEHLEWSIKALEAGKHVLCEKPFAMNAREAQVMVDAAEASGCHLIEAFHYRYHPLFDRVLGLIQADTIGPLTHVHGVFNAPIPANPGELRHEAKLGGGALMDLGCYPTHWVRTVAGEEPWVVGVPAIEAANPGVDLSVAADLMFPNGMSGRIETSMAMDVPVTATLKIIGETGEIMVINPLAPHRGHKVTVRRGNEEWEETVDGQTTYDHQLDAMIKILNGKIGPLTGGRDAVANMHLIDEIYGLSGLVRPA